MGKSAPTGPSAAEVKRKNEEAAKEERQRIEAERVAGDKTRMEKNRRAFQQAQAGAGVQEEDEASRRKFLRAV